MTVLLSFPLPPRGQRGALVAAPLAGLTMALAFPGTGWWPLGWIGPGLLFLLIRGAPPFSAALRGWLFGVACYAVTVWWVNESMTVFGGLAPTLGEAITLLLAATMALFPALFAGLTAKVAAGLGERVAFATAPFLWVAGEFVRERLPDIGFPWARLGDTQYRVTPVIQMAELAGTEFLSFVMIAFGAAGAYAVVALGEGRRRDALAAGGVALFFFGAPWLYGTARLAALDAESTGERLTVAALQGNIDQHRKWERDYAGVQLSIYEELTREGVARGAALVVWPETAASWEVGRHPLFDQRMRLLSAATGVPLIFGAPAEEYDAAGKRSSYNRAWSLDPAGRMEYYDKVKLAPFGEFVPFGRLLFFVRNVTTYIGDLRPGDRLAPLQAGPYRVGVQICFEAIFPAYSRRLVTDGAQLLAVITNDSWFGRSPSSEQALAMAVMRGVENRVPVVRAAQSGVSAVVGADGRILDRKELFETGMAVATVKLRSPGDRLTLYTRGGALFQWLAVAVSVAALVAARRRRG
ncbi:MAG: apolipoprotein N-acyltransferase [Nitrospinae bacterium]|nr:apolipoprotein N-acyltransferase [Nitrospinota bacterium]